MKKTFENVIKESVPTLVVFQHVGRQNAVEVKYMFEDLKKKYAGKANLIRVDASYNEPLWTRFQIHEFPTWVLFKEGEELMREGGHKNEADLEEMLKRAF